MNQSLLTRFGDSQQRMSAALQALREGGGVLLVDDEERENEGDLIYSTEHLNTEQMALMIRECSGIVCLCLPGEKIDALGLPPMTAHNNSRNQTAFTVSIEARDGVTTGVSAADRVRTIKTAADPESEPDQLCSPGHVFPLRAKPDGVLCELTNQDGTMAKLPEIVAFAEKHHLVVISIEDIAQYRLQSDPVN